MCPRGPGEIHTSVQAGGMASALILATSSGSVIPFPVGTHIGEGLPGSLPPDAGHGVVDVAKSGGMGCFLRIGQLLGCLGLRRGQAGLCPWGGTAIPRVLRRQDVSMQPSNW